VRTVAGEGLPKNNLGARCLVRTVAGEGFTRVQRLRASYLVRTTVRGVGFFLTVQRLRVSCLVRTSARGGEFD
jgi:hypothetical protein